MKKTIALVTGGFTGESVISIKSANVIKQHLDSSRYQVYTVFITPESWYVEENNVRYAIDKNDFGITVNQEKICFDAVFIALHGSPGEDGKLQGYFDLIGIPYTSCNALTSAITMNKGYTKAIVNGIDHLYTAQSVQLFTNKPENETIIQSKLQLPYFVKPNNGGSSIGMSKVNEADMLAEALKKAFQEDEQVLVEEFIKGREFTIGVYQNLDEIHVLPCTEIISSKEFFDFEAKYSPGVSNEITPGRMTDEEQSRVTQIVKEVYIKLNCSGMVRIDYILQEETNRFYFIEINTVPGQSENSIIPQQVKASGQTMQDFYTKLLESTLLSNF